MRLGSQRSPAGAEGTNRIGSMIHPKQATLAVALATLTISACVDDSLTAPPSPTTPRRLMAPTAPPPPSSTLQAPSRTDVLSEPGGPVAASVAPETVGQEAEPGEESAGPKSLPNGEEPDSETKPRDVELIYTIESFSARAVSPESIQVEWRITRDITYDRNLELALLRREASSGTWVSLPVAGLNGSRLDTGLQQIGRAHV